MGTTNCNCSNSICKNNKNKETLNQLEFSTNKKDEEKEVKKEKRKLTINHLKESDTFENIRLETTQTTPQNNTFISPYFSIKKQSTLEIIHEININCEVNTKKEKENNNSFDLNNNLCDIDSVNSQELINLDNSKFSEKTKQDKNCGSNNQENENDNLFDINSVNNIIINNIDIIKASIEDKQKSKLMDHVIMKSEIKDCEARDTANKNNSNEKDLYIEKDNCNIKENILINNCNINSEIQHINQINNKKTNIKECIHPPYRKGSEVKDSSIDKKEIVNQNSNQNNQNQNLNSNLNQNLNALNSNNNNNYYMFDKKSSSNNSICLKKRDRKLIGSMLKKSWKDLSIYSFCSEIKIKSKNDNEIIYQGELEKYKNISDIRKNFSISKFLVLTKRELKIYRSKESVLHLQKPLQIISLNNIINCDYYTPDFCSKKYNKNYYLKIELSKSKQNLDELVDNLQLSSSYLKFDNTLSSIQDSSSIMKTKGLLKQSFNLNQDEDSFNNNNGNFSNEKKRGKKITLITDESESKCRFSNEDSNKENDNDNFYFGSCNEKTINKWICAINYFLSSTF